MNVYNRRQQNLKWPGIMRGSTLQFDPNFENCGLWICWCFGSTYRQKQNWKYCGIRNLGVLSLVGGNSNLCSYGTQNVWPQTWYLSKLLHQQIFRNFEIYPKKVCNLRHFRPKILIVEHFYSYFWNLHIYIFTLCFILGKNNYKITRNVQWNVEFYTSG